MNIIDKQNYTVSDNEHSKIFTSPNYNYKYNKDTGFFIRYGIDKMDDPEYCPFGPEILDLEISSGKCSGNCKFCYKSNGSMNQSTYNLTFEQFKIIFDKIPDSLTQIAFGICDIDTNPDFFKMMKYSRENGIVPNYTCNGLYMSDTHIKDTIEYCGAIAVSIVNEKESLKTIKRLVKNGMKYVNVHYMLSEETFQNAFKLIDILKDMDGINAIVFLQYKPKGRNKESFKVISSIDKYKQLTSYCDKCNISFGFDSCSCPSWFKVIEYDMEKRKQSILCDPCESGLFSSYINCYGEFYPCSFTESEQYWKTGIDVLNCNDFIKDVWYNPRVIDWRMTLLNSSTNCKCSMKSICRSCPVFNITPCKREHT